MVVICLPYEARFISRTSTVRSQALSAATGAKASVKTSRQRAEVVQQSYRPAAGSRATLDR
jgi:hypothetical protein